MLSSDEALNPRNNRQLTKSPNAAAGCPLPKSSLAAHERALQGIVEIIITVIALVNTSEIVMHKDSYAGQSLFLEGISVPDALAFRVLLQ